MREERDGCEVRYGHQDRRQYAYVQVAEGSVRSGSQHCCKLLTGQEESSITIIDVMFHLSNEGFILKLTFFVVVES